MTITKLIFLLVYAGFSFSVFGQSQQPFYFNRRVVSANYTIAKTDSYLAVTVVSTNTLPAASTFRNGQAVFVHNSSSGIVTVRPTGSDTIAGVNQDDTVQPQTTLNYVSNGVGAWERGAVKISINPTTGYTAEKTNATTFVDGPIYSTYQAGLRQALSSAIFTPYAFGLLAPSGTTTVLFDLQEISIQESYTILESDDPDPDNRRFVLDDPVNDGFSTSGFSLLLQWSGTGGGNLSPANYPPAAKGTNVVMSSPWVPVDGDAISFHWDGIIRMWREDWRYPSVSSVSFANPSATVGLIAVNGSAGTAMRSDAAPALNVSISPTWTGSHEWDATSGTGVIVLQTTSSNPVNNNSGKSSPTIIMAGKAWSGSASESASGTVIVSPVLSYSHRWWAQLIAGASDPGFVWVDNLGNGGFSGGLPMDTASTNGFFYIQNVDGTPTGVPSYVQADTHTPLVFDRTNNKLYAYNVNWQDLTSSTGNETNFASATFTNGVRKGKITLTTTTPTLDGREGPKFYISLSGDTTVTLANMLVDPGLDRTIRLNILGDGVSTVTFAGDTVGWQTSQITVPPAHLIYYQFYSDDATTEGIAVDPSPPLSSYLAANATTTSTTMANSALSVQLTAGKNYGFTCIAYVSDSTAADGAKIDFDGGTLTATNFRTHGTAFDSALALSAQSSAIATDFAAGTLTGNSYFEFHGSIEVATSGTLVLRFAQNAHSSGTLTFYRGSHINAFEIP